VYRALSKATRDAFSRSDLAGTIHALDQGFAGHTYSLKNLFHDEQRKVLAEVLEATIEHSLGVAKQLYEEEAPLLRFLSDLNIPIPQELKASAEVALNGLLRQALAASELDQNLIQSLLEEMRIAGIQLDENGLEIVLRRNLETRAELFFEDPRDLTGLTKFRENLVAAASLPFPPVLWSIQNRCYEMLKTVYPQMLEQGDSRWLEGCRDLAGLLQLRAE